MDSQNKEEKGRGSLTNLDMSNVSGMEAHEYRLHEFQMRKPMNLSLELIGFFLMNLGLCLGFLLFFFVCCNK